MEDTWCAVEKGSIVQWVEDDQLSYFLGEVTEKNTYSNGLISLKIIISTGFGYFSGKEGEEIWAEREESKEHLGHLYIKDRLKH